MALDSTPSRPETHGDALLPLIQMQGVQKRFPGVLALDGITSMDNQLSVGCDSSRTEPLDNSTVPKRSSR